MRARSRRGGRRRVLRRLAHERWDGSGEDLHRARVESFMETLVDRVDGDPSTGCIYGFGFGRYLFVIRTLVAKSARNVRRSTTKHLLAKGNVRA